MNTKNIVCIELKNLTGKSLDIVAKSNNVSVDSLTSLKKEGVLKVWIDTDNLNYVAFLMKGEKYITVKPTYCPISKREIKTLMNMTPFDVKNVTSNLVTEVYDVFIDSSLILKGLSSFSLN